jgi:predicted ArsR family transcriptional regulator
MVKSKMERVLDLLQPRAFLDTADSQVREGYTTHGLGEALDITPASANRELRRLRARGLAHIHGWTTSGQPAAIWALGRNEDAIKPVRDAEYLRNYQKEYNRKLRRDHLQLRESGEEPFVAMSSRARTMATIERARSAPCCWFSGLQDSDEPIQRNIVATIDYKPEE